MKIAFFEVQQWEQEQLADAFARHRLFFSHDALGSALLSRIADADFISTFIHSRITKNILRALPNLKGIATRSTGFDHIDIRTCRKKGISVANVPAYGENTVAEHTFALILSLSRKIHMSYVRALMNDFSINGLEGFDLANKTLGVIGTGRIGSHVIRIARGFGMKVIAYDRYKNKSLAKRGGFSYVSLNTLLRTSDIVTLHVPLTNATKHLIDATALRQMKKNSLLINTARGDLVDTGALLHVIKTGHLGGAGLDVVEGEQSIKEERQLLHENRSNIKKIAQTYDLIRNARVVYTPHIAFLSREALQRILDTTILNIQAFIKKKKVNLV